jgi:peptide/nickel transport system permease protein
MNIPIRTREPRLAPRRPASRPPAEAETARRARVRPATVAAVIVLSIVGVIVIVVPFLPLYKPYTVDLNSALQLPFKSAGHILGTDELGRDLLSRIALATRISLLVVIFALALNIGIGLTLGLTAGYHRGKIDSVIMGTADLVLSFPILILLVTIVAVVGPSAQTIAVVLGCVFWVSYARVSRASALSLRSREYVISAITQGASGWWVIRKHLLPQVIPQVAIMASFDLGVLITVESSLSYLGLGIQPPTPSLGAMISDGQNYLQTSPWLSILPSIILLFLVGGVQLMSQRFTSEGQRSRITMMTS